MKPYKIPKTNIWVDLDTIQSIQEPEAGLYHPYRSCSVAIFWQHAFRDNLDKYVWEIESSYTKDEGYKDVLTEDGIPKTLVEITEEVFKPFFEAWTNK